MLPDPLAHQFRWCVAGSSSEVVVSLNKSLHQLHRSIVVAWLVAVVAAIAVRIAFGATSVSITEGLGWLMVASVPAVVVLSVFRGAPQTMAQMLYNTDHPARAKQAVGHRAN
jgi:hypothetical protein